MLTQLGGAGGDDFDGEHDAGGGGGLGQRQHGSPATGHGQKRPTADGFAVELIDVGALVRADLFIGQVVAGGDVF